MELCQLISVFACLVMEVRAGAGVNAVTVTVKWFMVLLLFHGHP